MLASTCTGRSCSVNGSCSARWMRATSSLASVKSTSLSRKPNSSPPSRATVSAERMCDSQPLAELVQERVAAVVAERVVDLLEPVEVHQQDGVRAAAALRALEGLADAIVEEPPVRQPRQRVVQRLMPQSRLGLLALDELRELARDHADRQPAGSRRARAAR